MKRRAGLLLVLVLCGSAAAEIPEDLLNRLKDATVLVNASGSYGEASGSGFVLGAKDSEIFIVTNAHVTMVGEKPADYVSIVLHSGEKAEKTYDATVVVRDDQRDLAVLKAKVSDPPKPITLPNSLSLRETMDVHIVGFPFGRALSTGKTNPSLTIGKGTISSIRKDSAGGLAAIQIDGDVNPGNSGGPIVTARGELVGICVAKIRNTGIGLAIPTDHLKALLAGQIVGLRVLEGKQTEKDVELSVTAQLLDPMGHVAKVRALIVPAADMKAEPVPDKDGKWGKIADARLTELTVESASAATGRLSVPIHQRDRLAYYVQLVWQDSGGNTIYMPASKVMVSPFNPAPGSTSRPVSITQVSGADDWLGSAAPATAGAAATAVEPPNPSNKPLLGEKLSLEIGTALSLTVDVSKACRDVVWNKDGTAFYLATADGVVRKITCPGLVEERLVSLKHACTAMSMSSQGLVVFVPALKEVWLLSPDTLAVQRQIYVKDAQTAVSCPALSVAMVPYGESLLAVVDLKAGQITDRFGAESLTRPAGQEFRRHAKASLMGSFEMPQLAPDGKTLFCLSRGCLHRVAIEAPDKLAYQEAGPPIAGSNPQGIDVSNDSKYVAVIAGGGNPQIDDHPKITTDSTYVYSAANLQQPVVTLETGPHLYSMSFDPQRRRLYANNNDSQLITYQVNGRQDKALRLGKGLTRRLVMDPTGASLLVLTESALYCVQLTSPAGQ